MRVGRRVAITLSAVAILTSIGALRPDSSSVGPVAIVVHPETDIDDLSFGQLRNIFLGDQQFWPDRRRVKLLIRADPAYEREVVLTKVYRMSESQLSQYWITKVFRAEISSGPTAVYGSEMALKLVSANPGSITFVSATEVSDGLKVLRIENKLPGQRGYPLQ